MNDKTFDVTFTREGAEAILLMVRYSISGHARALREALEAGLKASAPYVNGTVARLTLNNGNVVFGEYENGNWYSFRTASGTPAVMRDNSLIKSVEVIYTPQEPWTPENVYLSTRNVDEDFYDSLPVGLKMTLAYSARGAGLERGCHYEKTADGWNCVHKDGHKISGPHPDKWMNNCDFFVLNPEIL